LAHDDLTPDLGPCLAQSVFSFATMRRFIVSSLLFAILAPVTLAAQAEGYLPKTTQLPASTRAMALGDSYVMNSRQADAIFYHPALLTGASGVGLELQRWGPSSSSATLSGAVQWLGGGVGIGVRTLQYGAFGSGDLAAPSGQDHLFDFGSVPVSERVVTVGYARDAFFDIDVGVAMDLVDQRVGSARQSVALFDVSAAREVGPLGVALTVHDLGEKPILDPGGKGPAKVVLGAGAYGEQIGIFDFGFAANVGLDNDDVTYGGGVELGYWPIQGRTFVARVGFQSVPDGSEAQPFTTGFAFWGDDVTIEWAYRPFSGTDEGGSHRFGLRWR
jgi:hypothetical protein